MPQRVVAGVGILDREAEPAAKRILQRTERSIRLDHQPGRIERSSGYRTAERNRRRDRPRRMRRELVGKAAHEGAAEIRTRPQFGQRRRVRMVDHAQIDSTGVARASANNSCQAAAAPGSTEYIRALATQAMAVSSRETKPLADAEPLRFLQHARDPTRYRTGTGRDARTGWSRHRFPVPASGRPRSARVRHAASPPRACRPRHAPAGCRTCRPCTGPNRRPRALLMMSVSDSSMALMVP